jgi:hypothetical protein
MSTSRSNNSARPYDIPRNYVQRLEQIPQTQQPVAVAHKEPAGGCAIQVGSLTTLTNSNCYRRAGRSLACQPLHPSETRC